MFAKITTLEEIRRSWSLADLATAHLALDVQEDIDRELYHRRRQ